MESLDGRLRSFAKPKGKSAARAWPHPDSYVANPTSLAEAGFYFKPSKDDPDNVRCFICKKELGGWDEDDNPFEIHVKKCPKCPWAIARCSLEFDVDSKGNFSIKDPARLPSNKALEKARADTFGGKKWWPHDTAKNHGATSKKMAKAGFVYTPQVEGDDTATCFYCDLSLSGWDEEDDPTEEHLKRVERSGKPCPFFQSTERSKSQASTRSTKSTSRKSCAPKHADTLSDGDEEIPAVISEPMKKAAPSSNGVSSLGMSTKHSEDSEELEEDDDPSLKVNPAPGPQKSSKKPASKSKPSSKATSKNKSHMTVLSEDDNEVDAKPARSRSQSGKKGDKPEKDERDKPPSNVDGKITKPYKDFAVVIDVPKAKEKGGKDASRGRSRSKPKPRSTEDAQSKPLLRAASRSRVSGITEAEDERETEEMLAVPPSDADQQPEKETKKKPRSKARKRTKKTQASEKPRGEATAPPSSAVSDNFSSKPSQGDNEEAEGQRMDIDGDLVAPERKETVGSASQQAFPTPASPSDFKAAKTSLVSRADDTRRNEHKSVSPRVEKAANDMDVHEDALPESQSSREAVARPVTPEEQIIRLGNSKVNAEARDFEQALEVPPSPADLFLPPLASLPVQVVAALTATERAMSVEEWIRHEMGVQYARLKEDGQRRIEAFLERAAETRRQIEAL